MRPVSKVRRALPTPVKHFLRKALGLKTHTEEAAGEKSAEWYDKAFESADGYHLHYTKSPYYTAWTVIIDRLRASKAQAVLEIACGPGQLACAVWDSGLVRSYHGFDFSEKRIAAAKLACPGFAFEVADAFTTTAFEALAYDTVIATEFLEHVEEDLRVLDRIRPGTRFIGTVPNYPYVSHVRHFVDTKAVSERYADRFEDSTAAPIVRDQQGHVLFLIEGIRLPALR